MNKSVVLKAKKLMYSQTLKNGAPAWELTEIAIKKGRELSKKYKVREDLVLTSLYLAHSVFSTKIKGKVQSSHEEQSAVLAEKYLRKWKVLQSEIDIISNSIRAHHSKVPATSKVATVMQNAESFKFLTIPGILALIHSVGLRKMPLQDAIEFAKSKAKEKLSFVSLKEEKKEAKKNYEEIMQMLNRLK